MVDTVLFDLDGTLLHFTQDEFIPAYFAELKGVFARLGLDAGLCVKAVWAGTKAMSVAGGEGLNSERFWGEFSLVTGLTGEALKSVERSCDNFYTREFDSVKSIVRNSDASLPARLVRGAAAKGFTVALATNPLFPHSGMATRLNWVGLGEGDFRLVTHYSNCRYCKPHLGFYTDIFETLGKQPGQCLMAGNSPLEDMSAAKLGAEVFLVTDCLENETGVDTAQFRQGTLAELEGYLAALPKAGA